MKPVFVVLLLLGFVRASTTIYLASGDEFDGKIIAISNSTTAAQVTIESGKVIPLNNIVAIMVEGNLINGPFDYSKITSEFPELLARNISGSVQNPVGKPDVSAESTSITSGSPPKNNPPTKYKNGPYHLSIQGRPAKYFYARISQDVTPYPARFLVARFRLYDVFGFEVEPVTILNGAGGYGYFIGPTIFQSGRNSNPNPLTISFKYNYLYFENWGDESRYFIEVSHQVRAWHFLFGFGGEIGFGLNGISSFEGGHIYETSQGAFIGLIFDMGICL